MSKPSHLTKETHAAEDVHVLKHRISIYIYALFLYIQQTFIIYVYTHIHLSGDS